MKIKGKTAATAAAMIVLIISGTVALRNTVFRAGEAGSGPQASGISAPEQAGSAAGAENAVDENAGAGNTGADNTGAEGSAAPSGGQDGTANETAAMAMEKTGILPEAAAEPEAEIDARPRRGADALDGEWFRRSAAGIAAKRPFSPTEYNLMRIFPEGETESVGKSLYEELCEKENSWLKEIFRPGVAGPYEAAALLGKDQSDYIGKYDPKNKKHVKEDPSTWKITGWEKVEAGMGNGNGSSPKPPTNVKQIMAMTSVYAYYHDLSDPEALRSYAMNLWNASHSSSVSMSGVYYDDCRGKKEEAEEETQETQEIAAEASPSDAAFGADGNAGAVLTDETYGPAFDPDLTGPADTGIQAEDTSLTGPAAEPAYTEDVVPAEAPASAEEGPAFSGDAVPEEGYISSGEGEAVPAEDGTVPAEEDGAAVPAEEDGAAVPAEGDGASEEDGLSEEEKEAGCPGHADLSISVTILTMDGDRLFRADRTGNASSNKNDRWDGWSEARMAEARELAGKDWDRYYGLTDNCMTREYILGGDEIEAYMAGLPEDLSEERRSLVGTALESVGRIPYYYGGKPSGAGYEPNRFYSVTGPDYRGRMFRGLDCSGWISWVYWTALGTHLSEESTAGLVGLGTGVSRDELLPGDIIVDPADEDEMGHVVMFYGRNEAGEMICIHETGSRTNTVTIEPKAQQGSPRRLIP